MDLQSIKNRLDFIRKTAGDDEIPHGAEDQLYADFVKYVADLNIDKLSLLAKEILKSKEIEFNRYYV